MAADATRAQAKMAALGGEGMVATGSVSASLTDPQGRHPIAPMSAAAAPRRLRPWRSDTAPGTRAPRCSTPAGSRRGPGLILRNFIAAALIQADQVAEFRNGWRVCSFGLLMALLT